MVVVPAMVLVLSGVCAGFELAVKRADAGGKFRLGGFEFGGDGRKIGAGRVAESVGEHAADFARRGSLGASRGLPRCRQGPD